MRAVVLLVLAAVLGAALSATVTLNEATAFDNCLKTHLPKNYCDFMDPINWAGGVTPNDGDDVVITWTQPTNGTALQMVVNESHNFNTLTIQASDNSTFEFTVGTAGVNLTLTIANAISLKGAACDFELAGTVTLTADSITLDNRLFVVIHSASQTTSNQLVVGAASTFAVKSNPTDEINGPIQKFQTMTVYGNVQMNPGRISADFINTAETSMFHVVNAQMIMPLSTVDCNVEWNHSGTLRIENDCAVGVMKFTVPASAQEFEQVRISGNDASLTINEIFTSDGWLIVDKNATVNLAAGKAMVFQGPDASLHMTAGFATINLGDASASITFLDGGKLTGAGAINGAGTVYFNNGGLILACVDIEFDCVDPTNINIQGTLSMQAGSSYQVHVYNNGATDTVTANTVALNDATMSLAFDPASAGLHNAYLTPLKFTTLTGTFKNIVTPIGNLATPTYTGNSLSLEWTNVGNPVQAPHQAIPPPARVIPPPRAPPVAQQPPQAMSPAASNFNPPGRNGFVIAVSILCTLGGLAAVGFMIFKIKPWVSDPAHY